MLIEGFWAMLVLILLAYVLTWAGERGGQLPMFASGLLGLVSVIGWACALQSAGAEWVQ